MNKEVTLAAGSTPINLGTLTFVPKSTSDTPGSTSLLHVVDQEGQPVWGASIGHTLQHNILATSADGRAAKTWLGTQPIGGRTVSLLVRAPGFGGQFVEVNTASIDEVVVTLEPEQEIRGRVLNLEGQAVGECVVEAAPHAFALKEAFPSPQPGSSPFMGGSKRSRTLAQTRSAADGSFVLRGISSGSFHIRALRTVGRYGFLTGAQVIATGVDAGTQDALLAFDTTEKPTRTLRLRVVAARGEALSRVSGSIQSLPRAVHGRFEAPDTLVFEDVRHGTHKLEVTARDHVTVSREVIVGESEADSLSIQLKRGWRVRGQALLNVPDGTVGRLVMLHCLDGTHPVRSLQLDALGRFELRGVAPGRYRVGGYAIANDQKQVALAPKQFEVDLRGTPGTRDLDLDLVPGAFLVLKPTHPGLPPPPWTKQATIDPKLVAYGKGTVVTLSDQDGNVLLQSQGAHNGYVAGFGRIELMPDRYAVRVRYTDGIGDASLDIDLSAGDARTVIMSPTGLALGE